MTSIAARRGRGLALVLIGLLTGTLMVQPVSAHLTQDTRHLGKHVWKQFVKDRVYTRSVSDKRFTRNVPGAVGTALIADGAVTGPKLAEIVQAFNNSASVVDGAVIGATVPCPAGTTVIGGGFDAFGGDWRFKRSSREANGWRVVGTNLSGGSTFFQAYAYCLASE